MFRNSLDSVPGFDSTDQQPNGGGLLSRIRLIPLEWVEWMDISMVTGQELLPGSLILKPGRVPVDIYFADDSGTFAEQPTDEPNGIYYQQSVGFQLPKDRPELSAWIDQVESVPFLALIQDRNRFCRLVGTLESPLRMTGAAFSTSGRTSKNGRPFGFACVSKTPAFFVPGIEDTDLESAGTFDDEFFYNVFDV